MTSEKLNSLDADAARDALERCCGSRVWVDGMLARRPFLGIEDIIKASDTLWWSLQKAAWLEAFSSHPRIGEKGKGWSAQEQRGMDAATQDTAQRMLMLNRAYEEKFGWTFIVCATGKTADEMLALIQSRLNNNSDSELTIAAGEQAKITRLRLQKLLAE